MPDIEIIDKIEADEQLAKIVEINNLIDRPTKSNLLKDLLYLFAALCCGGILLGALLAFFFFYVLKSDIDMHPY